LATASAQGSLWDGISTKKRTRWTGRVITELERLSRAKARMKLYREKNREKLKAQKKLYIEKNRERVQEWNKDWRTANREKMKEYGKVYKKENVERIRQKNRRWYGIQDASGEIRSGLCPICLRENIKLVLDHDHETKLTRGWLCSLCNTTLGHWEKLERIRPRVIAYLAANRTTSRAPSRTGIGP
jgi:hypothetical protein